MKGNESNLNENYYPQLDLSEEAREFASSRVDYQLGLSRVYSLLDTSPARVKSLSVYLTLVRILLKNPDSVPLSCKSSLVRLTPIRLTDSTQCVQIFSTVVAVGK